MIRMVKYIWLSIRLNRFYSKQNRLIEEASTVSELAVILVNTRVYERGFNEAIERIGMPSEFRLSDSCEEILNSYPDLQEK